jgi:DUF1365 family protein
VTTLFDTRIAHGRTERVGHGFAYRHATWLVDLDALPELPRPLRLVGRFDARDHFGDPATTIRANVDAYLATEHVDLDGGRVLMLANARAFGYTFNPLSVFWCYDRKDELVCVVAEVHNTYGDRHAYLLRPDADGRVDQRLDKAMYVSPFNPVDGHYRIVVSEPAERVSVSVTLERDGQPPFVATLLGTRRPSRSLVATAVATAATSARVSMLIRWQGVRLFLRGLRVEPRPIHSAQEAVS